MPPKFTPYLIHQVNSLSLWGRNRFHNPGSPLTQVSVAEVSVLSGEDETGWDKVEDLDPKLPLHALDVHV